MSAEFSETLGQLINQLPLMQVIGAMLVVGIAVNVLRMFAGAFGDVPTYTQRETNTALPPKPAAPPPPTPQKQTRPAMTAWEMAWAFGYAALEFIVMVVMDVFFSKCKHCRARYPIGAVTCKQCGAPRE